LFVATNAYLSAAFLITDAQNHEDKDLVDYFAFRAIAAGAAAGVLAIASLFFLHDHAYYIYHRLTHQGLPLVIISIICGSVFLVLLMRGARKWLRPFAIAAVVAVIWGWGVGQYPYLLPTKLSIADAAGPSGTLWSVLIVFVIAGITVIPSLGLLYWLSQKKMLEGGEGE
jgi:cytochrome d ubiquinol oxidase subunit II